MEENVLFAREGRKRERGVYSTIPIRSCAFLLCCCPLQIRKKAQNDLCYSKGEQMVWIIRRKTVASSPTFGHG